eukprot:1394730-Amorphochlora_amoeboformis.AAC.2
MKLQETAAEEIKLLECAAEEVKVLEGELTGDRKYKECDEIVTVEDENEEIRNENSPLRDIAMFVKKKEVTVYVFVDSVKEVLLSFRTVLQQLVFF